MISSTKKSALSLVSLLLSLFVLVSLTTVGCGGSDSRTAYSPTPPKTDVTDLTFLFDGAVSKFDDSTCSYVSFRGYHDGTLQFSAEKAYAHTISLGEVQRNLDSMFLVIKKTNGHSLYAQCLSMDLTDKTSETITIDNPTSDIASLYKSVKVTPERVNLNTESTTSQALTLSAEIYVDGSSTETIDADLTADTSWKVTDTNVAMMGIDDSNIINACNTGATQVVGTVCDSPLVCAIADVYVNEEDIGEYTLTLDVYKTTGSPAIKYGTTFMIYPGTYDKIHLKPVFALKGIPAPDFSESNVQYEILEGSGVEASSEGNGWFVATDFSGSILLKASYVYEGQTYTTSGTLKVDTAEINSLTPMIDDGKIGSTLEFTYGHNDIRSIGVSADTTCLNTPITVAPKYNSWIEYSLYYYTDDPELQTEYTGTQIRVVADEDEANLRHIEVDNDYTLADDTTYVLKCTSTVDPTQETDIAFNIVSPKSAQLNVVANEESDFSIADDWTFVPDSEDPKAVVDVESMSYTCADGEIEEVDYSVFGVLTASLKKDDDGCAVLDDSENPTFTVYGSTGGETTEGQGAQLVIKFTSTTDPKLSVTEWTHAYEVKEEE